MEDPIDIGRRRELFVNHFLIDRLEGASLRLATPTRREVVFRIDGPNENVCTGYYNLVQDGAEILMYYRGCYPLADQSADGPTVEQTTNLARSRDGVHFERPALGVFESAGTTDNNLVWRGPQSHNLCAFLDANPAATPEGRFKAVGGSGKKSLYGLTSPDGIHWKLAGDQPLEIPGAFDSLNVAFWDAHTQRYRLFSRYWEDAHSVRAIQSCESEDFVHWTDPTPHQYADSAPWEHFYTNATVACPGAEHLLLSFPMRFIETRTLCTEGMDYPSNGVSDAVMMSSRDGVRWDRTFLEAWLRPGLDGCNWTHRNLMTAVGIVETGPDEWSMYVSEHYGWAGNCLRRVTLRPHGFASVSAGWAGGEMLTRPITFAGTTLRINYATSAAGEVAVELQDEAGRPIEGFALGEMEPMFGDELDAAVNWRGGADLTSLVGRTVRMRFALEDADLFALRTA